MREGGLDDAAVGGEGGLDDAAVGGAAALEVAVEVLPEPVQALPLVPRPFLLLPHASSHTGPRSGSRL